MTQIYPNSHYCFLIKNHLAASSLFFSQKPQNKLKMVRVCLGCRKPQYSNMQEQAVNQRSHQKITSSVSVLHQLAFLIDIFFHEHQHRHYISIFHCFLSAQTTLFLQVFFPPQASSYELMEAQKHASQKKGQEHCQTKR